MEHIANRIKEQTTVEQNIYECTKKTYAPSKENMKLDYSKQHNVCANNDHHQSTNVSGPLIPDNYSPSQSEEFMNPVMCEYFKQKLLAWKKDLINDSQTALAVLKTQLLSYPDAVDRASSEFDSHLFLRTSEREYKLINKIDIALDKINRGEYGYCEKTGEPISVKRLEARLVATLCLEAQESHERNERMQREDCQEN